MSLSPTGLRSRAMPRAKLLPLLCAAAAVGLTVCGSAAASGRHAQEQPPPPPTVLPPPQVVVVEAAVPLVVPIPHRDFAKVFAPVAGAHRVVFVHPYTCCPVEVC